MVKPYLEDLELRYMDCDWFFLSFKTKDIIKDLSKEKQYFVFSELDENHELFSYVKRKVMVNVEMKLLKVSHLIN